MLSRITISTLALCAAVSFAAPASAAVIVITHSKALAGNVTPPDTPGYPVTLSLPGAYRLDTNLTVPAGKNGIHVTSDFVEIDMNGFRLWGWNAAGGSRIANNGVYSGAGFGTVRNGSISGFRFDGIRLVEATSGGWAMQDLKIFGNGEGGIDARDSDYHRMSRSNILRNSHDGIFCRYFCLIEGSVISDNGEAGVAIGSGTVLGNTIGSNRWGVYDVFEDADTGVGNNTLIGNVDGQTVDTIDLQPNACIPSPCDPP